MSSTRSPLPALRRRLHLATLALVVLASLGAALVLPAEPTYAATAVTTSDLNLRVGYLPTSKVKLVMPAGAVVEIVNRSYNGYWKVVYQGIRGYAYGDYLDFGGGGGTSGGGSTGSATTTSSLNLRSRASVNSAVLLVMSSGASVSLTGQSSNGFLGVVYRGTAGWASAAYLSAGGTSGGGGDNGGATGAARTTSDLNLRSRASVNSAVLLVMPPGASITLTGQRDNGFLGVTYRGTSGWASANYISTGGGTSGGGASSIIFPVTGGGGWTVIQGYNGGTHQGTYQNALDIARASGSTAGWSVIAPVSGTVVWNDFNSGGILIDMGNGLGVAMFHCTFDGSLGRGSRVTQGQWIGTISGPGGRGYAVTPHIDINVWDITSGRVSRPFTGANALGGVSLSNNGSYNQHYGNVYYP